MQDPAPHNNRENIDQYSGFIAKISCDIAENNLPHEMIRTDIEHIDLPVRMYRDIDQGCSHAAGKKDTGAFGKSR